MELNEVGEGPLQVDHGICTGGLPAAVGVQP